MNIILRRLPLDTLAIAAIAICALFTLGCALAVIYHWREEFSAGKVLGGRGRRRKDNRLDDTELQRRQLLKLLSKNSDRAPSPDVTQNTFRIDLPEPANVYGDDENDHMPQRPYEFHLTPPAPSTSYNPKSHPIIPSNRSPVSDAAKASKSLKSDQPRQARRIAELGDL